MIPKMSSAFRDSNVNENNRYWGISSPQRSAAINANPMIAIQTTKPIKAILRIFLLFISIEKVT